MKKLMIAAAIVCAAVVSQGANYYWSITASTDMYEDPVSTWNDASVMAVLASTYDAALANKEITSAKWFTDNAQSMVNTYSEDGKTVVLGDYWGMGVGMTDAVTTEFGPDVAGSESFYLVLVKDGAIKDGGYMAIQKDLTGYASTAAETTATDLFIGDLNAAWAAQDGQWTAYQTVPEPTSGLLLLLGVAGLALRRRRA